MAFLNNNNSFSILSLILKQKYVLRRSKQAAKSVKKIWDLWKQDSWDHLMSRSHMEKKLILAFKFRFSKKAQKIDKISTFLGLTT